MLTTLKAPATSSTTPATVRPFHPFSLLPWFRIQHPTDPCPSHSGGQVRDPSGQRPTGLLDTIVPYDFESRGQIDSDILHQHLVSNLPPNSTLFVILDCCHSGSALELPFIYRSDDDGNVNMVDNVKQVCSSHAPLP